MPKKYKEQASLKSEKTNWNFYEDYDDNNNSNNQATVNKPKKDRSPPVYRQANNSNNETRTKTKNFLFFSIEVDDDSDSSPRKNLDENGFEKYSIPDTGIKATAIKFIIIYPVLLYLFSLLFQNLMNFGQSNARISFNPITIIFSMISYGHLIFPITLVTALIFTSAIIYFLMKHVKELEQKNYEISNENTYGSSKFATDGEMGSLITHCPLDRPDGIVLGKHKFNEESICISKSGRNENVAIFGASGSGKSFSYARPNILQCIDRRKSFIITDPSGELYRDTAKLAEQNGITVKVLNLRDFYASDGWNCLKEIDGENSDLLATTFTNTVIENTVIGMKTDKFWDNAEQNLLKALVLYVGISKNFKGREDERNIRKVYQLIVELGKNSGMAEELGNLPEDDAAWTPYQIFLAAGKLQTNIVLGLATRLQVFQNDLVAEALSHDEIDLSLPAKKPCGYYVISSTQESTFNFLSTLFFSFVFIKLVKEGENKMDNRLDVPVYMILDEFPSIGRISDFENKIANVRKYGISISIIFQDLNQMENRYPQKLWASILSNCDTHLVLGCNDQNTAEFLSKRSGEATIKNISTKRDRALMNPLYLPMEESQTNTDGKRVLFTPHEILTLPEGEVIIIVRGQNIYKAKRYGYIYHYYANYIDEHENKTLPKEHIPNWKKLLPLKQVEDDFTETSTPKKESDNNSNQNETITEEDKIIDTIFENEIAEARKEEKPKLKPKPKEDINYDNHKKKTQEEVFNQDDSQRLTSDDLGLGEDDDEDLIFSWDEPEADN